MNEKFEFVDLEPDSLIAFMRDRKVWVDLKEHIDPTYYNDKNVSKIFQIFRLYFNKYKDFPTLNQTLTLAKKYNFDKEGKRLIDYVYNKTDMSLGEVDFIKDEMTDFIKNSKTERAIFSSVDLIEQKKYKEVHQIITDAVMWNPDIKLGTNYSDAVKRFAVLGELMENIVTTPWDRVNYFLGGGLYRKELYLFAASSSVGKSIALDQCALHAWDLLGLDVVIFTFEMSEERKGQRIDACKFGIPITNVYNKRKTIIQAFEKEDKKNKLFIKELPQTATTADMEQYLYQLELYEGVKPALVVADYMDIMSPRVKIGKDYNDQGAVGADLRDMAKLLNVPIVSASQFSRSALETSIVELTEGKLADSFKKMMIADGLIGMASTPEERQQGVLHLKGLKNRNGPKDWIIRMRIRYEILKITDGETEDIQTEAKDIIKKKRNLKKKEEEEVI